MKFVSFGLAVVLSSGKRLAKVRTDAVFTAPCETSILYPSSGGNMHCFTAKTACAVLDVLGPPYSIPERHCTYYYDHAYAKYAGIFLLCFLIRKGIDIFIFRNVFISHEMWLSFLIGRLLHWRWPNLFKKTL